MLKSLIILGHVTFVFLLSFMFSDEISITDNFPESVQVNPKYEVTATIVKNDVVGFAKYQINVPSGVVIKPISLSGASFTFKDGKAKFIWMNLPKQSSFDIQYEFTIEEGLPGAEKEITSKFSYLVDNNRNIHQGPNHVVIIAGESAVATTTHSTTSSEISASRSITAEGDYNYLVEIDINKLGVKGFAKIQDIVPEGFTATEVANNEAIFTQTGNKVKLVWFDIPKKMNMKISYLLEAPSDFTGVADIEGDFHYMAGSDLKKVEIPKKTITIGGEMVANVDNTKTDVEEDNTLNTSTTNSVDNNVSNNIIEDATEDLADTKTDVQNNAKVVIDTATEDVNNTMDNTNTSDIVDNNTALNTNTEEPTSSAENVAKDNTTSSDVNNTASTLNDNTTPTTSNTASVDNTNHSTSTTNTTQATVMDPATSSTSTYETNRSKVNDDNTTPSVDNTNSSKESDPINTNSNNNSSTSSAVENITTTVTPDMTADVEEPESTKVSVKEYVKDNILKEDDSFTSTSSVSDADSGITYRVQLMAGKNVVGKEYLRKRHNFHSKFSIENHEGWIKYTYGTFGTYKSARDQRNMVRGQYNFDGPFVSAYNDGERITVQEALMISKQKWYN